MQRYTIDETHEDLASDDGEFYLVKDVDAKLAAIERTSEKALVALCAWIASL